MILDRVEHPRWLSNTWLVADAEGGEGILVDAGGPADEVIAMVRRRRVRVGRILLTHHHVDHAGEAAILARATGAVVAAHRLEIPLLAPAVARSPATPPAHAGHDVQPLDDGDVVRCGGLAARVLHIPGHTAGQAAFVVNDAIGFTGDTLFRGSIGSTTAAGHTTFADLRRSIVTRLMTLPDGMQVAPGHAAPSTIGDERAANPFVRVMLGLAPEGTGPATYAGRVVRLVAWGDDYDGGHKAWVRFAEGGEASVPGSQVRRGDSPALSV